MLRVLAFTLLMGSFSGCGWLVTSAESDSETSGTKQSAYARVLPKSRGAVASVNPLATQAGVDAFNRGGNAIDAALAVAFTLGVVDSHNSGVGGGCFILARLADGQVIAIDGREMAPSAAHRNMFVKNGTVIEGASKTGALAVGIPGSVAALYQLQTLAGKLQFQDVLLPAADLAEQGFAIDKTLASRIIHTQQALSQFPASAKIFLDSKLQPLPAGALLKQPDLAESYRALAHQGPNWFYKGEFARRAGDWMKANRGLVTAADFANYHTQLRQPILSEFRGYTIVGFPPPSSGGTHVAQILNMLDAYDLGKLSPANRLHLQAETMRRAFADRAYWLGDSDFVTVPKGLLSTQYAQQRMQDFSFERATANIAHGDPVANAADSFDKHTTHIATADKEGNWIAITTTLNTSFGSKVMIPGTGILLNNQMDDFSIQPGVPNAFGLVGAEANSIAPGKRPLSSMSPTLVLKNEQPIMTLGAAGGPTIITQVAQALMYRLALGYSLKEAVAGPRVHHQWRPDMLFAEDTIPEAVIQELSDKGHRVRPLGNFGATQAIEWRNGQFSAVTEPRLKKRNQ